MRGEDTGQIKAEKMALLAEVLLVAQAHTASSAGDERKHREAARSIGHRTHGFVSKDERRTPGAGVSPVGVQIGPTDPGKLNLQDDLPFGRRGVG